MSLTDEEIQEKQRIAELIYKLGDGAFPTGGQFIFCHSCGFYYNDDVYIYQGKVMCGDCRYKARTGRVPAHEPHPGFNGTGRTEDEDWNTFQGGRGSKTNGRFHNFGVDSELSARILEGILDDCKLSIK